MIFLRYSCNENTKENDFVVNFDISAKWLNIRKDSLKRTLIESYQIDLQVLKDIISKCGDALSLVKKTKITQSGGGNKEDGKYYIYLHKIENK